MITSVALGAVLALAVPAVLVLMSDREDTVSSADIRSLTEGVRVLGGVPRFPEDPAALAVLVTHPDGVEAAVRQIKGNADAAGWRRFDETAVAPNGVCASVHTLAEFLDDEWPQSMERAVRDSAREYGDVEVGVLIATAKC